MGARKRSSISDDGVHLLSMIEKYSALKLEKARAPKTEGSKEASGTVNIAEQEALFGSKPSPKSGKKVPKSSTGAASSRRQSLAPTMLQILNHERTNSLLVPQRRLVALQNRIIHGTSLKLVAFGQ